jgi:uncharacterized membrane protein YczE
MNDKPFEGMSKKDSFDLGAWSSIITDLLVFWVIGDLRRRYHWSTWRKRISFFGILMGLWFIIFSVTAESFARFIRYFNRNF